jgi:hypothetical protein
MEVKIDKLVLLHKTSSDSHAGILEAMYLAKSEGQCCSFWKEAHSTCFAIKLDQKNRLFVRIGTNKHGPYATFAFNPSKLSPDGMDKLCYETFLMFDHGFSSLMKQTRLRSVELAVDVKDVPFFDVVVVDTASRKVDIAWYQKGSLYLGGDLSPRSVIVYDKAKELLETKNVVVGYPLTRIEVKLRPTISLPLSHLSKHANPFESLAVAPRSYVETHEVPSLGWSTFRKTALLGAFAPQQIYRQLPSKLRPDVFQTLRMGAYSWWKPATIWDSVCKLASEFAATPSTW